VYEKKGGSVMAISYSIRDNTLYRRHGTYDFTLKKWLKKTTHILAPGFISLTCKPVHVTPGIIDHVLVESRRVNGTSLTRMIVKLRNRVL